MSKEIADAHYSLPTFTSYNFDDIPFAYPPLSFYITAAASDILHIDIIVLLRYLPLIANLLTIISFFALSRSLLQSRYSIFFATTAFVLAPRSYEWLIMGGGLTRSLGFLFAITALARAKALYESPTLWRILWCAVFAAMAVLTHLEMGLFVFYSLFLFFLIYGRSLRGLATSFWLALCVVALTAPWWLVVISRHGLSPYYAASATAGWFTLEQALADLINFVLPQEPLLSIMGALAALGILVCLMRWQLLLPLWLPVIFILTPRSAATEATVPLGMLAGIGMADVVLEGLTAAVKRYNPPVAPTGTPSWSALFGSRGRLFAGTAAGTLIFGYVVVPHGLALHLGRHSLDALSAAERHTMQWIAQNTPETSTFLIFSPRQSWEEDYVFEWFPVLARRKSVLTPQGAEWLPSETHARRACLYSQLKSGAVSGAENLDEWTGQQNVTFSHLYISRYISRPTHNPIDLSVLRTSLLNSPDYTLLLDDAGGTVLARTGAAERPQARFGEHPIAPDCQTLFNQSEEVQRAFHAAHGELAPWIWLEEHARQAEGHGRWRLGGLR